MIVVCASSKSGSSLIKFYQIFLAEQLTLLLMTPIEIRNWHHQRRIVYCVRVIGVCKVFCAADGLMAHLAHMVCLLWQLR